MKKENLMRWGAGALTALVLTACGDQSNEALVQNQLYQKNPENLIGELMVFPHEKDKKNADIFVITDIKKEDGKICAGYKATTTKNFAEGTSSHVTQVTCVPEPTGQF